MRRFINLFLLTFLLLAPLQPVVTTQAQRRSGGSQAAQSGGTTAGRRAAEQITAVQLRDYLSFIASDEMEGRDTPSRGLDITAKFIAMNLSRWGVRPAGDNGTYFQNVALLRTRLNTAQTSAEVAGQSYKYGDDFLAQLSIPGVGGSLRGTGTGSLVYVGNGWVVSSMNMNAYQGVDVKDKIMIVAGTGLPRGVTYSSLARGKRGQDWSDPMTYALAHGARGIIYVPGFQNLAFWNRTRQAAEERGALLVEKFQSPANPDATVPAIVASLPMLTAIMRNEKRSASDIFEKSVAGDAGAAFDLDPKKRATLSVAVQSDRVMTQNVVGVWEGSDPVLKNEYVAVGAHYDHVGVGTPVNGDAIYNGADDDGSGTVAILAMAEAFARASVRPKRSILFVWHCGEEKGLWGSRYFTENPTVPLNQIVTQLNIDMIGRSKKEGDANPRNASLSGPNEIYVIGSKMMSTELGALSDRVNASFLNVSFNFKYDDPKDPNRFFFRSDHYNYARKGIPIIFYFDGEHEDYHRPGDEPAKIDYQKMEKVTRTIFLTGWEIANLSARPTVDKQLPAELNR